MDQHNYMVAHMGAGKKKQILRSHPKAIESETLGRGPGFCVNKPTVILLDAQV